MDDTIIREHNIGVGDEVSMTGLFNKLSGQSKNLPIVRSGNVALIPEPDVLIPGVMVGGKPVEAEAYLVEARSIGGISGSPVFVRATGTLLLSSLNKATGKTEMKEWSSPGEFYFLGLVHGHWEINPQEKNDPNPRGARRGDDDAVNMGIAVVIPAKKILEVLNHPELVEMRSNLDQVLINAGGETTPD